MSGRASITDGLTPLAAQFLSVGTRTGKLAWVARDGRPVLTPVWFLVDGGDLVFNTGKDTPKGRAMARDPRVALCVDLEQPPFAFVQVQGTVTLSEELAEVRRWATALGGRYMGADRAEEFGIRNGVPGELLVRLTPTKVIAELDVSA